jgi:hypothetical protein
MTNRFALGRGLLLGTLLLIAPFLDVVINNAVPGLMHLIVVMTGIALLAATLSSTDLRPAGYEPYDPS